MISVNERAAEIVRQMITDAEALGVAVSRHANGATVVDAGVEAIGSLEAGRLFSEVCMGGLGAVSFCELDFDGLRLPGVSVTVRHPPLACVAAQMAGWPIRSGDEVPPQGPGEQYTSPYSAMGSGPARALYGEEPVFEQLGYRDRADVAVLALEVGIRSAGQLPPEAVTEEMAIKCQVSPSNLFLLVASVDSQVGSVQVAARVVEVGMHKMMTVGFDIRTVLSGFGTCPLAPVTGDDVHRSSVALGRANDAILYGGRAWYMVRTSDAAVESVMGQLPSSASRDYGTSFYDLFQRYDRDFYRMDPLLFGTAEVSINNLTSGRTFRAGAVDSDMVRRTLLA